VYSVTRSCTLNPGGRMSSVPITSTTLVLPLSSFTSAFITFSGANSAMRSGCWKASNTLSSGASNLDTNFACQVSPVFSRLSETISFAGPGAARAERERRRDRVDAEAGLRVRQRLAGDGAQQAVGDPVAEAIEARDRLPLPPAHADHDRAGDGVGGGEQGRNLAREVLAVGV